MRRFAQTLPWMLSLFALWVATPSASAATLEVDSVAPSVPAAERQDPDPTEADGAAEGAGTSEDSTAAEEDWTAKIDKPFGRINGFLEGLIFVDVWFWDNVEKKDATGKVVRGADGEPVMDMGRKLPFAVVWLVAGALFFTIRMGLINLRGLGHAIAVTRGKYDDPNNEGEVSHFQALSAALSATVGLGNIAGVAIAVTLGGPGATFWMICAGFLGMASKFTECTLGQKYRETRKDGRVMGGAMYYLSKGLKEKNMGGLGMTLAVLFAVLCVGGSLAGGNSFQVNQSLKAIQQTAPFLVDMPWIYGGIMTVVAGFVIIGGIQRIASAASAIVPAMCGLYVAAAMTIILMNAGAVPDAFGTIINGAFNPDAAFGGFIGVLIVGFQRAAFSNEAGVGSAAIAHAAAKTDYPVREGIVALLEPFIDTIVVCTMTALVIVITGYYDASTITDPALQAKVGAAITAKEGAALTSMAMASALPWFPYVLSVAVMLFAFSTMISWSYYGERCWAWMFGDGTSMIYRIIFLAFTFFGSIATSTNMLAFGDTMIMGMAIPNILGVIILSKGVRGDLDSYWNKLKNKEFKIYK